VRERPEVEGDRFRLPWRHLREDATGDCGGGLLRWLWERAREGRSPNPAPSEVPADTPAPFDGRHRDDEARITFLGHAALLIQAGGVNVLTDPMLGDRASPLPIGPRRFAPPALGVDELPEIHAVVISHDHYDHLDDGTVRALDRRFGDRLAWCTPLGYRDWFRARGIRRVYEADWWESVQVAHPDDPERSLRAVAAPAQHWCRRGLRANTRLWASWSLDVGGTARIYFAGDSGYWHGWLDVGAELGPWDAALLPIGAYEPRWFMRRSHMNPEEAVRAWRDLGGRGLFVGMHWGAFRLTDEPPLEPPARTRDAWRAEGLPEPLLRLPGVGGTVVVPLGGAGGGPGGA